MAKIAHRNAVKWMAVRSPTGGRHKTLLSPLLWSVDVLSASVGQSDSAMSALDADNALCQRRTQVLLERPCRSKTYSRRYIAPWQPESTEDLVGRMRLSTG